MNLFLMRHCQPTPGMPMDGSRSLTPEGVAQAQQMAAFLVNDIGRVDYVVTSPFNRAAETAEIVGEALGAVTIASSTALQPDGNPKDAWAEVMRLAVDSKDVLVVSHDPLINALLFWLIGLDGTKDQVRFDHGSIAHLKGDAQSMRLHWFITPKLVEREQAAGEVVEAYKDLMESVGGIEMGEEATVKIRPISDLEDGGQLWQVSSA